MCLSSRGIYKGHMSSTYHVTNSSTEPGGTIRLEFLVIYKTVQVRNPIFPSPKYEALHCRIVHGSIQFLHIKTHRKFTSHFLLSMEKSSPIFKNRARPQHFRRITRKPLPEFIDPVFAKTNPKLSFCMTENERIGLIFVKTGSINSGTWRKFKYCQRNIYL